MSQKDSGSIQHQAEHTRTRRQSPILGYLLILFAAAFLLLLLAYFQQQRAAQANSETIDALKQSASAVESIQNLIDENARLREQVEELEREKEELKSQNGELEAWFHEAEFDRDSFSKTLSVYQDFFRLDRLYRAQRFSDAAELIRSREMVDWSFSRCLSDKPVSDDPNETTPLARYKQICTQLLEWNYLRVDDLPHLAEFVK